MTKYVAPIKVDGYFKTPWFTDKKGTVLEEQDIATVLTEYLQTKAVQEECGAFGHVDIRDIMCFSYCPKCGARL